MIKKLKLQLKKISNTHLIVGFLVLGLLCVFMDIQKNDEGPQENSKNPSSVDTYIPKGMTLVPIDIQNIDSLRNILGTYGVVDLYVPSLNPRVAPKKVATHVKIMRAPLNPDVFAVLVKEEDAPQIASHNAAFFVTIQNPQDQNSKVQKDAKSKKTQIITEM